MVCKPVIRSLEVLYTGMLSCQYQYFKEPWKWNPILESPQGLITLFDELWFLSRALCPVNLRKESYVKFLDQDSTYTPLIEALTEILNTHNLDSIVSSYPVIKELLDTNRKHLDEQFKKYEQVIEAVYGRQPDSHTPIDHHSHGIELCGLNVSGSSRRLDLLAYDIAFLSSAGIRNIELITNSFNSKAFKVMPRTIQNTQVAHGITINRVPFLQTPSGPVITRIEAIRESNYLIDFRDKIVNSEMPENFIDLVPNIEKEFQNYRNDILLQYQNNSRIGTSIANNAISFVAGKIIPCIGEIKSLKEDAEARKFSWTGFLADIERNT